MALYDLFGKYDADADPLANPDEKESQDLALHVRADARRYASVKRDTFDIKRWFILLILVLILSNAIDVKVIVGKLLGL